jgi:glycosyltransferase involved in cell wall biosynthesis
MPPLVSVILPVYNCERYLFQAVECILTQSLQDFELILINDGSTDRSGEIAAAIPDPRIRYYSNPKNLGLVETLNRGLSLSQSELIARMDGDDLSLPNRLEEQYRYLSENPRVGVLGTAIQIIDPQGKPLRTWRFPSDPVHLRWTLIFTNPVAHPTVMMRRSLVAQVGGYRDYEAEDIDLWERLCQITDMDNLPAVLVKLRKHPDNRTNTGRTPMLSSAAEVSARIIQRLLGELPPAELVSKLIWRSFDEPGDPIQIARLVERLCHAQVSAPGISPATRRILRRDAARRLLRIAEREMPPGKPMLPLVRSAIALDPFVLVRASASRLSTTLKPHLASLA